MIYHNDVTAAEAARLSESQLNIERRLSKTLDSLLEGIQIIDFNWRYLYVNDILASYEKTTKKEFLGQSIMERYPGIEHTDVFKALELSMFERTKMQIETEFVYPDKSKRWLELNIEPVEGGVMVLSLDITSRKEADDKIQKAYRLYSFISQINQKIVRVTDEETLFGNACSLALEFGKFKMAWIGKFDDGNNRITLVDHSGIPTEEIHLFHDAPLVVKGPQSQVLRLGMHYICNDIEHDPELREWKSFATRQGIQSCMVLPLVKSGRIIGTFNLYATELNFCGKEETALLVEVASDISFALDLFEREREHNEDLVERKIAEENLIRNNDELQKTNSELDRFVYSASHDLRAPLCSVLGLVSLIETNSKEPATLRLVRLIGKSVNRLDGFIRNILSYSKNNRLEKEIVYIPLRQTITDTVNSLRNIKEAEGLVFEIDMEEEELFYSELHRFNIVIENLISNAIKFQDYRRPGRFIKISGKSDMNYLDIDIADNGIGIPLEHQPKIFDMFFRISGERVGSGIGLYIVKETVEKLQGSITVDSTERVGTTFHVRLKNLNHRQKTTAIPPEDSQSSKS